MWCAATAAACSSKKSLFFKIQISKFCSCGAIRLSIRSQIAVLLLGQDHFRSTYVYDHSTRKTEFSCMVLCTVPPLPRAPGARLNRAACPAHPVLLQQNPIYLCGARSIQLVWPVKGGPPFRKTADRRLPYCRQYGRCGVPVQYNPSLVSDYDKVKLRW